VFAITVLLLGAGLAAGQTVNLTAGATTLTLPDGSTVPMWGYSCGAPVSGSTATCAASNPTAAGWSPVVITVPTGTSLTINLTNNLSFTPPNSTTANTIPTSLMIVGQVGGGLGDKTQRTTTPSPVHGAQGTTWSTVNTGPMNNPPPQGARVQSFSTEVAAGAMTPLTWTTPRAGTYLLESGTHPSIQAAMGLIGMLVVTNAPTAAAGVETAAGTAYPGVSYDTEIPLLFSEIDPVQNNAVNAAVNTAGFSETAVWSGQPNNCGNPASANYHTCYPPVVNYSPLYYLINGVAFNKTSASGSLFAVTPATTASATGSVLVRMVNAGSRMHVPSIVGAQTGTGTVSSGFALVAEDGNPLPGLPRVQSEVFMAAGKTYDVMVNVPAAGGTALPVYDRELSLSGNAIDRDAGMLAYVSVNGAGLPAAGSLGAATAVPDTYNSLVPGKVLTVSDPSKGVLANDLNVYGVKVSTAPLNGSVVLNANGTFTYTPGGTATSDSFGYCGNGATTGSACTTVTLKPATIEGAGGISLNNITYTSKEATFVKIPPPGVLAVDTDSAGYPLSVVLTSVTPAGTTLNVTMDPNGGFIASVPSPGTYTFTYQAQNSQGTLSTGSAQVTLVFPQPSNLQVSVVDGKSLVALAGQDYRWIIEEDRSFYVDPTKTANPGPSGPIVPILGVNFHTSDMPFVAQGCTGPLSCEYGQTVLGQNVACDLGNGACRTTASQQTAVLPSQVVLDPTKRYYITVLPGDAANPFTSGNQAAACSNYVVGAANCGHSMGGAPIAPGQTSVTVLVQRDPFPPAKLSVNVFEDDFPLNGEQDAGGGVDVLSPNEPGLGGFNIILWDDMGGSGDVTGQMTYDMFNMPLGNSLDGQLDPATGLNACPITKGGSGITGMIVTCPKYESDGKTLSPLAGQAVVSNLMPGRFSVQAIPGADRIARGEEWLQTNTLDGQKAHDSFLRIGEPAYFQEFGPAGYHVSIGFANPKIINSRLPGICAGTDPNLTASSCNNSLTGKITTERMSRTPDERLYSSGSRDSFYFSQCYVSVGDPDGEDFAFTKCAADGTFSFTGLPAGSWRITAFDQWNDQIVDGLSTPVGLGAGATLCPGTGSSATSCNMGDIATSQWQANVYTRTFIDKNKDGVSQSTEDGIPFLSVAVRYRDGSLANGLVTDFTGTANFNETFPLFNWYVVETDTTRYKSTGIHTIYDAGGPADGSASCGQTGYPACGNSLTAAFRANTAEKVPLPANLSVPGAVYCANADCTGFSILGGAVPSSPSASTGRIDAPWVPAEGWQGYSGQNNFIEFGKTPYVPGENGGIHGHVIYASTRPFDDPQMLVQTQWEPLVPHVTINLYQEGIAPDGVTQTLKLVDTTQTSSWDDWAQGFRTDGIPNMNCPGQSTADLFYFSLYNQPEYLSVYNSQHGGPAPVALPNNSQFKCYDGMHNWNQLQPAPYDGMYSFPSITGRNPSTGNATGTNCTICTTNPDSTDAFRFGKEPMLPAGKYVVEVVPPPGYEIVKEEDKNILIGDNFIAPVTQQFGSLSSIFIIPDQAAVGTAYNPNNAQNMTQGLGTTPQNGIVPGFIPEPVWPCVGQQRIVPDYISLFPQSKQVAPFAGATRNLCDRKEVTLSDQAGAIAKFYIYTSTHKAAKFTGVITDDFTSEFDPFSPQFGEKFAPANMPISVKDWTGSEISRVYSDWWGDYDGLTYSTWEVNPPNPTGYSPTMMVFCMNDKGSGATPDPLFNPAYSQFCYELPYMPGQTQYLDTPVVPTSAFSAGYNHPDCAYPAATPAVKEVDGDGIGPWVSAPGKTLTITSLTNTADLPVANYAYSGPSATTAPFNTQTITRHYGFGTQCTAPASGSATCNTKSSVTIGGVAATITSWSDSAITVTVPNGVPACAVQQQAQYGGSTAYCGELTITAGNGKQSVDTVMVTIGGKAPTRLAATASASPLTQYGPGAIQQAIDAAQPGDLIIVPPGSYSEMLLMWKPVRLQGVGAASSVIDANTQPAGKLDPWRRQVDCLFGIALNGTAMTATNPYDAPTDTANGGGPYTCSTAMNFSVDRLPLEAVVGWDATLNGNLAELLQEPTLMGAYEGAAITVLGKGVKFPAGSNPFGSDTFPTGTLLLTPTDCGANTATAKNPYPSNFQCNPARIDGLSITDSSQGGGGIFAHGFNHNLEISNNRIFSNIGTLSGGINIGQGEFPPGYFQGGATNAAPGSCMSNVAGAGISIVNRGLVANQELPYCFNLNVNVHNNAVTSNSSIGDELFSATPAGAGGVSFATGADYYKFNYNWVCGNMSTGDGGGFAHLGLIWNGDVEHNTILYNQSLNPTISTNGGGIQIQGTPDVDPTCGITTDADCAPPGMSDGTGPGLVINANLIQGNAAESGSGGGLRLQDINGTDVSSFPSTPSQWYSVQVTNNIITNNVAGWDGAGVSLQDALSVNLINNTIVSNDSTATAGVLFNTLGAPMAGSPNATNQTTSATTSAPQPAGLVSVPNSPPLVAAIAGLATLTPPQKLVCPANHAGCGQFSNPYLANDLIWQNRTFYIGVGALSATYQQNVVSLYNSFTGTPGASQPSADATTPNGNGVIITGGTGACTPGASYWEIGVRGDSGPSNHGSGFTLAPVYSVLTDSADYPGLNNLGSNPTVNSQYCNGSRIPPEFASGGFNVPPGISDASVPNPIFNLTPAATVDEGNNWVNLTWGPLSLTGPVTGTTLGNYALASGSPAIDAIPDGSPSGLVAPKTDFFGNVRPSGSAIDVGAVEFQAAPAAIVSVTGGPLAFGNVAVGTTSAAHTLTLHNTGTAAFTGTTLAFSSPLYSRPAGTAGGTCGANLAAGATCTIGVVFSPTAVSTVSATLTITGSVAVTGSPVALSGSGVADVRSATLTPTSWTIAHARNCPGTGILGALACTLDPAQTFTLTNTGNVPLTGIAQGALGGTAANVANYSIVHLLSTCGPAGGGQLVATTTLAPGATCVVTVQFKPLTAQAAGAKPATVSVTDVAGTQTSTLSGTAQ